MLLSANSPDSLKVSEYKDMIKPSLRLATLCFLVKGEMILLAMKKRGFGAGRWNGVGRQGQPGRDLWSRQW